MIVLDEESLLAGAGGAGADTAQTVEAAVRSLAEEAARRVGVPYLAVDVGQLDDRSWTVIEVGDAQFAGLGRLDRRSLLEALARCSGRLAPRANGRCPSPPAPMGVNQPRSWLRGPLGGAP